MGALFVIAGKSCAGTLSPYTDKVFNLANMTTGSFYWHIIYKNIAAYARVIKYAIYSRI